MKALVAVALVSVGLLAAGCSDDESLSSTLPRFPDQLSDEERRRFDERIEDELARARERKSALVAANRRTLDGLPRLPGSRLIEESQNPESSDADDVSKEEAEFDMYASQSLEAESYLLLTASGWGTFRTYSIPAGRRPDDVHAHFLNAFRGRWQLMSDEQDVRGDGIAIYLPTFRRGPRCLWFHIGTSTGAELRGEVKPGQSFDVATDLRGGAGSVC